MSDAAHTVVGAVMFASVALGAILLRPRRRGGPPPPPIGTREWWDRCE